MAASFVLIHGGSTSHHYWDRLAPRLPGTVLAPDVPGRLDRPADLMTLTVEACVDSLLADIQAGDLDPDLVLVAHSSGGLFVPGLLRGLGPRVRHLVYSSASIPGEGDCGLECMRPRHAEGIRAQFEWALENGKSVTTLDGPAPAPDKARTQYGGDPLDDATLEFVMDPKRRVPDSFNVYFQPISWQGIDPALPTTYLSNLRDRAVPLALQHEMLGRLPFDARVIAIDGGHVPSVTDPGFVATLLTGIAAELAIE